jgi:phosphoserine phosphatase
MQLAIFDVDGTLISGYSSEKRFIAWLFRRGLIGPRQVLASAWFIVRWFPVFGRHVFRKNKAYLSGLSEASIAAQAALFVAALPESVWIRPSVTELRLRKEQECIVVLLSGTLQSILDAMAERLGADDAVGTICRTADGRYQAAPPLRHPFAAEKAALQQEISERYQASNADVTSYADSVFDILMLSQAGRPVAVCPDSELAAWARINNHRVIEPG